MRSRPLAKLALRGRWVIAERSVVCHRTPRRRAECGWSTDLEGRRQSLLEQRIKVDAIKISVRLHLPTATARPATPKPGIRVDD